MKKLNGRFLGVWCTTDVLAFPSAPMYKKKNFQFYEKGKLGEIIISLDTAIKQARERKIPINWELTLLALHGYFHLIGGRDTDMESFKKMRALEFESMVEILPL